MKFKAAVGAMLVFIAAFTGLVEAAAYDLPKIKVEKKRANKSDTEKEKVLKSDWKSFLEFEAKLKTLLANEKNLSPSDSRRIGNDKNLIFVSFYKGRAFFLDRYSIEVIDDEEETKTWRQHIFPIGEKLSGKSSRVVKQTFHLEGKNFYNSSKLKNNLNDIENEEDKNFMRECFKVGYYYTFGKEVDF